MPKYRIKSDILGVDFGIRTDEKLTERDYFDILKTKVQPQDLLHAYKSAPYDEKRQNLATKALDNGFFDQDVGFTESVAEVGGMVGQGIGDMLTTNIYATSRLQRARMQYGDADTEQVYQPLIEEGIKKAGQQLKGLAYAAKRTDRSIEDDLSQAMQFAGIPRDDENLQRRVIAEAQRQDQSQVAATQAQMGVEAAGMMAMIGAKGNELIERVKADSSKESKLAQIEYLADKFDIAEKIEKGAELGLAEAGLLGTLTDVYLGKNLSPFDVNQEALEDVQSGLVEPDREVAMVGSVVADPSFVATMGAAGGVNAMRNVLARGMVIRTGEKAAQESSLRLFLSRAENIAKPSTQQKALIKSAEQKLAKVAGSGEKLDKLVAKSQGVAQAKVGSLIQSGEASTQSGARLVNSLSKALENAPAPKAPIFNRMTGKILERAGMTTETLGRTIEFIQRLPEETLTTLFMKTGGMSQEAALTAARGTARTLQTGAAAGVLTGGFNEFSPELENLGLALLLAPGGSSLVTRFGHDAAILGKQLQFAQASSPLFQRIAQLDPADASLTSVIIDRSSALTIPETISGLAEGIFSKSRQFGPSPALKVPSTALAKTGLGNTLTGAVNTAKTVVGASTIPGAIGYALDGEAGAGGAIGASWPFLAAGLGMGTLAKFGSKSDLYMKMAGDEAYFKDTYLDSTDRASYESQPRIVRQAIATSNIQNPDVIFRFKEGKPPPGESSNFSVENGESVITIYGKSHPQEVLSAIFGHEIAHHIDTFGFMPQIIDELIGSVEKGKPGVYTEFKNGKPVINKDAEGREVYATNKEFQKHRQQYLDRLEAGGIKKGTDGYDQYANNDAQIAREIFAAHGADWYFGGEFVNKNWQGAGAKMMGAMLDPLFGSTGLRKFFHRIGLATSEETGLVADPTGLFPGLKQVPALTRMIEKYNSDVRGYGPQARREGRGRGNLVDPAFKDEVATVNLTAKDLENPAIVNRLKAGGVVKIKDDGTIETDVQGRPVFLPTREVNKNNKKLSNDILEIIRKKEDAGETFGEGHVSLEKTVDGRDRATGVFIDPSIIDQLQGKYNPHQLAALKQINQTLRNGTGDVWDLFYYSALKYNKAGRKVYGQIKGGDRTSLPFGIEITKDGNINIQTISMDAFIKNLEWFAKSKGYSQKMAQAFGGNNPAERVTVAEKLLPKYLQNHLNKIENGTKNPASGITDGQRDLINAAIGRMNADQVKANPVLEGLGDRRSQRQQSYRSRRLDRIGNAVRGEPGYPAVKSAIEQNKLPMRIPNEADVAITEKLFMPASEAGAGKGKQAEAADLDFKISTRNPTAKNATENPITEDLIINTASIADDATMLESHALALQEYPGIKKNSKVPKRIIDRFVDHVVDNLLYLHDQVRPEVRNRSKLWYDGARNITEKWNQQYGNDKQSIAAALASLSPQKDWFMNVDLARRMLDIYKDQSGFAFDKAMAKKYIQLFEKGIGKKKATEIAEAMVGKTLNELQSDFEQAAFIRSYDEVYNPREYQVVSPEGDFIGLAKSLDGVNKKVAWGSMTEISKAVKVLRNPSKESISTALGNAHKIRNFYNNILLPNADEFSVTIDTHAIAAALLRPLAGADLEVANNFGSKPKGAKRSIKNSSVKGISGTYGIYADAYRKAAEARGILPREMQSITWEAVRGLYEAKWKTKSNKAKIDNLWKKYENGELTLNETREQILEAADGIREPEWVTERSDSGTDGGNESSNKSEELYRSELGGSELRANPRGGRTNPRGSKEVNFLPAGNFSRQPANRIQQQAPAMPGNRFMAPAASAGAKLSERFR